MNLRSLAILLTVFLLAAAAGRLGAADDSGTFRGRWWNYYDRALAKSEKEELTSAAADLRTALGMREKDQRMARTYGMHFIDYFPHRELGIVLYRQGDLAGARTELETSLAQAESAKAAYYLNKVRKGIFEREGRRFPAPRIVIEAPAPGTALAGLTVKVKGRVTTPGLVAGLSINRVPVAIELAREELVFEREIPLEEGDEEITVSAADLLGTSGRQTVTFAVDRDGPAVSLEQARLREGFVYLAGQVEDRTGISRLTVGGKNIEVGGARSHRLELTVPQRPGERVEIRAIDLLGNETVALCDPQQELATFAPRRLLLAASSPLALFDRQPPTLILRDIADQPAVYVDRYYVEGEAADSSSGIDRIVVAGHEVALARGKKVFFSKVVKLREGENRIVVEAFDRAGNRSQASFTVRRIIPAARQLGSRMSVSLLPFDGKSAGSDLGRLADDFLLGALVDQRRFQVVERTKLQQLLREQKLAADKLTDPEHSVRIGRLLAADAILATTLRDDGKSLEVVTRVINTETAEVLEVQDVYTEERSQAGVREQMEGLAAKVARCFPLAEGMVIGRERRAVLADLGSAAKVKKSMGAIIYRQGQELKHPVTGRSLGRDTVKLGEGWFEEVQPEFSRLRLAEREKASEIAVRDLLITR